MFDFSGSCVRQSPHVCFLGRRRRAHGIPEKNVPISLSPSLCFFLGGGGGGGESIELLPEKRFLLPAARIFISFSPDGGVVQTEHFCV